MAALASPRGASVIRLRSDGLFWRPSDGEVIALDAESSRYYLVNPTAATIWERLQDGATEADLADSLCERFAVERDVAESAVTSFLEEMEARGLLEREVNAGPSSAAGER